MTQNSSKCDAIRAHSRSRSRARSRARARARARSGAEAEAQMNATSLDAFRGCQRSVVY